MDVTIKSYRPEREKEIVDNLRSGMGKAVLIVERQAKQNVSKTGSEHPQVKTGRLRASITSQVTESGNEIVGEIGSNVIYSKMLEFGTSRMPPYPFLFPAVEMSKDKITEALKGKEFIVE